jgi:hypothetical protein
MNLTIMRLLSIFLVFFVAFVKLLSVVIVFFLPLIWALGNEISILAAIVAHPI